MNTADRFIQLLDELHELTVRYLYADPMIPRQSGYPEWADGFIFCWPDTESIRVAGGVL